MNARNAGRALVWAMVGLGWACGKDPVTVPGDGGVADTASGLEPLASVDGGAGMEAASPDLSSPAAADTGNAIGGVSLDGASGEPPHLDGSGGDAWTVDVAAPDGIDGNGGDAWAVPADGQAAPADALPPPLTGTRRIVPGRARLVGTHGSACSNQPVQSGGSAERWCAFSTPGATLGRTDLWVINVSKAMAGVEVRCDAAAPDPNCKRLTTNLWTEQPASGPIHPTSHLFDGDTLIFHAEVPAASVGAIYDGPIFAWRLGWENPRRITGAHAVTCSAHVSAQAAVCIENITPDNVTPLQFDLTAGRIDGNEPLKTVGRITPARANQATQWRSGFTRDGESFLWSTGGVTIAERETLFVVKTAEIGDPAKVATFDVGVSRWNLSLDGQKLYYYRNYNYSVDNDPSGTLTMADFPSGMNETALVPRVGAYQLLFDGTESDRGLAFFDNVALGKGNYKIMRDRNNPMQVTPVVQNVSGDALVSRDLRFVYFSKDFADIEGTSDAWIARTDGSGAPCALTTTLQAELFGPPFLPNGNLAFWADRIDADTGTGELWVGNPDGCTDRRKVADGIDFWFVSEASDGVVLSDTGNGSTVTLRFASIANGILGPPTAIHHGVERIYGVLPGMQGLVFQVSANSQADGLYTFGDLPFRRAP